MEKMVKSGVGLQLGMLLAIMTWNWLNSTQQTYWSYFMTDVAFISTGVMGTILIISRVVDLVSIPVVGIIIEKLNPKWGKYRSWLVIAPIYIVVCFLLMFINYDLPDAAKAIILCLGYSLATIGINAMITAHNSVPSIAAKTIKERSVIAAKKGQGSALGAFFFGLMALPIIVFFNGGSQDGGFTGYIAAVLIFGACCVTANFILFHFCPKDSVSSKEDVGDAGCKDERLSTFEMLKIFFKDLPLIGIIVADGCRYLAWMTMMGMVVYYFTNVLGDPGGSALFFSVSGVMAIIGSFLCEALTRRIDKRVVYIAGLVILIAAYLCAYFFAVDTFSFLIMAAFAFLGLSFVNSTQIGMYADAVDYGMYKSGRNCKAWLTAMCGYAPKIGIFGSSVVVGVGMTAIGYDASATMSLEVAQGINFLMTLLPACLMILGLICVLALDRLNNAKMVEIRKSLAERGLSVEFVDASK